MKSHRFDMVYLIVGSLAAWEVTSLLVGGTLTPPLETLARAGSLVVSKPFWIQAEATAHTLFFACAIVFGGGLAAGSLIGSSRLASDVVEPILTPMYAIPKIALYPIILLIFGLSPLATIVFAAIHGIFPVMIFTIAGLRKIKPIYVHTARVMRLTRFRTIVSVLLPAALPEIVAGLRVGFATTLFGALIAELFASTGGLGFMLIRATDNHNMTDVMAITVLLFVFAILANSLISRLEVHVRHSKL